MCNIVKTLKTHDYIVGYLQKFISQLQMWTSIIYKLLEYKSSIIKVNTIIISRAGIVSKR